MTRLFRFGLRSARWMRAHVDSHVVPAIALGCLACGTWLLAGPAIALIVIGAILWIDCLIGSMLQ